MLAKKDKKEMYLDAFKQTRKEAFRKVKDHPIQSLDEYIQFLNEMQKIFPLEKLTPIRKQYRYQKL